MKYLAVILISLSLASCTQNQPVKTAPAAEKKEEKVVLNDENKATLYNDYTGLKDALVKSDSVAAKAAAGKLASSLAALPGCSAAAAMADEIEKAPGLEDQRNKFAGINSEIVPMFKKADLKSGSIYVQYCPMANNSKGAFWLSSSKDIRNPYYGDEMLECGEVKQVIN